MFAMLTLFPIPAFSDNYIWLLHNGSDAWVVDPGDAAPVQSHLREQGLTLRGILLTHHHADHTGGVDELRATTGARVFGPAFETLPEPVERIGQGDQVELLGLTFDVLEVPGHTAGHIAYFAQVPENSPLLFCGDTLFSGGCGRLFEGTPAQMLASLDKLAALPSNTRVCCTHEYTLSNLRFALAVEPGNADLAAYNKICEDLRAQGKPTLPSNIGQELRINPFLRSREPTVVNAIKAQTPQISDEVATFAALREWKNNFR
jgi:hydroxyacylglutathione hydrolase